MTSDEIRESTNVSIIKKTLGELLDLSEDSGRISGLLKTKSGAKGFFMISTGEDAETLWEATKDIKPAWEDDDGSQ